MSTEGHGLPDSAIKGAHDIIHHAEQEEHEHVAAGKRGLGDDAVEAEHEFMKRVESQEEQKKPSTGTKVKEMIDKLSGLNK